MECSIKGEKAQAMKNYKRAKFVYNFALYSLTSLITCFFFSYSFWFPSMMHFLSSLPYDLSLFLDAKCFFIVGNLIVFFLIGEFKLQRSSYSSSSSDIYDEYIERRRTNYIVNSKEIITKHGDHEKICHKEKKKETRVCKNTDTTIPRGEEKKKGMRASKSEVWSVSVEEKKHGEQERMRLKEAKNEIVRARKSTIPHEEKKRGMRASKSEVWGENIEEKKHVVEEQERNCQEEKKNDQLITMPQEEKKIGMRASKSEVWGENEILERERAMEKREEFIIQGEELNKRVEAFIARVNKQRLLEAKLVRH